MLGDVLEAELRSRWWPRVETEKCKVNNPEQMNEKVKEQTVNNTGQSEGGKDPRTERAQMEIEKKRRLGLT